MNDSERTALVDELAEAMMPNAMSHAARAMIREKAAACLPIIDRIKQEAYSRGQRDAYNDAANSVRSLLR